MQITLLGTGADHCIPAFRCTCSTCSKARRAGGRHFRQNSSAIIASDTGDYLLLDMPPQILSMLTQNRIDDSRIRTVLSTHRHEDHTLGLRYLFQASVKKQFHVNTDVSLFIPASTLRGISGKLLSEKKENLFTSRDPFYTISIIENKKSFMRDNWNITPIETGHLSAKDEGKSDDESFGYIIQNSQGKVFVYLLDAAIALPRDSLELLKKIKKIDCLVGDCTYETTTETSGHMDIKSLAALKEELQPKRTVASHVSHMNLPYKELEKKLESSSIELGYDGMKLEI